MSKNNLEVYVRGLRKAGRDYGGFENEAGFGGNVENEAGFGGDVENEARFGGGVGGGGEDGRPRTDAGKPLNTMTKINTKKSFFSNVNFVGAFSENEMTSVWMELYSEDAEKLKRWKGEKNWAEIINELVKLKTEKLEEEKPKPVKSSREYIPAAIKNFILKRSNCLCEFPGCMKPHKSLHHADRFALKRMHDPDRIFALCQDHHDLAHFGLIENEDLDIKYWKMKREPNKKENKFKIDKKVISFKSRPGFCRERLEGAT